MASIRELYGRDPIAVARDAISDAAEKGRRAEATINANLLNDDAADALKNAIKPLFPDGEVYRRICNFIPFTDSQGLFGRVIREIARPVYSIPPTRKIDPEGDQEAFSLLRAETRYDARMAMLLEAALSAGDAMSYTRYVASLEQVRIEVVPAHAYTVIPHPDDPTIPCGVALDRWIPGQDKPSVVVVDDVERFMLGPDGLVQEAPGPHNLPRAPFVHLHIGERSGAYWNSSPARALRSADLQCRLLNLLALRHLKVRGFDKYVISGDFGSMPKDQPLDEEGAIAAPDGVTVSTLGDRSDAKPYLDMLAAIKLDAAANRGISRARLNQDSSTANEETGLIEERAELIRMMTPVEREQVEVLAMVSREHPTLAMSKGATLASVDFGEIAHRVDRKTQLELRDTERKMGVRSVIDDLLEDNPELKNDDEAWDELERNIAAESRFIEARRALNIPRNADVQNPGQSPEDNGAMGRLVRDGRMTPGAARDLAREGEQPDDEQEPA